LTSSGSSNSQIVVCGSVSPSTRTSNGHGGRRITTVSFNHEPDLPCWRYRSSATLFTHHSSGVRLNARIQEGDLEGAVGDGAGLADELVQPRLGHRAVALVVHISAVARSRRLPVDAHPAPYGTPRWGRVVPGGMTGRMTCQPLHPTQRGPGPRRGRLPTRLPSAARAGARKLTRAP
jgi:hypothetical protein